MSCIYNRIKHVKSHTNILDIYHRPEAGNIKLILPKFVSYLGERGVLCVGNG